MDEVFLFIQILERSVCAYACTLYSGEGLRLQTKQKDTIIFVR